jgi:uncharacterized protein YpmS
MLDKIAEEREKIRQERRTLMKDAVLIFVAAALIAAFLLVWKSQITGFATLETFETETFVAGSSSEQSLRFEEIPNFVAKVGEKVKFKVEPNQERVKFSDDTTMFEIDEEGIVEFTPTEQDVGNHNIWIIIKDDSGHYYYQNVVIMIEE